MSLLERRIAKLERPNVDTFDPRQPASWSDFYSRIKDDGPASPTAPALSAKEAWAISSTALNQADDESLEESWLDYLQCRKSWR
jgi:hypothetical protein